MVAGENRVGSTTTDDGGGRVEVGGATGDAGALALQSTKVTRTKAQIAKTEVLILCHNLLWNNQSLVNDTGKPSNNHIVISGKRSVGLR